MSKDLAELFRLDPLKYTETDIDTLIKELRSSRKQYNLTGTGGSTKKITEEQRKAAAVTGDIDI